MAHYFVKQLKLEDFITEFDNKLDPNDELVQLTHMIDWQLADRLYFGKVSTSKKNTNSKEARFAFGALILQQLYDFTDRLLISMVKTNPYFQYFLGMGYYKYKCPFTQSTLVQFRKRITPEMIQELNESICRVDDNNNDISNSNKGNKNNDKANNDETFRH